MDLGELRAVLKIAELGSFTQAARSLGVTQPAISQQVARLEAELGKPLFDRQGRRIALTEAGEKLCRHAGQIVALADDARRIVTDDDDSGTVIVAAIPTIAPYLLPTVLSDFREAHPRAQLEVHEEVTASLLQRCANGEIDVGLLALPAERRYLHFEKLYDEELLLVLPADHPLAKKGKVRLEDLHEEPFVLLDEAHCLSGDIRSFCLRKRFQPVSTGRTTQLATVQELVALGHGVSLIPAMAARRDTDRRRVYRSLDGTKPKRTIAMCWNPDRYQSRLAQALLTQLRTLRE
ncbi:MAG TPA: LysR family transcriptional regulator [Caulifigura sp.]|nr:LysR family transcriptional regulator [Caulifigura sp.]